MKRACVMAAVVLAAWAGGCASNQKVEKSPTAAALEAKKPLVGTTPSAEKLEREKGPLFK